MKHIFIINPTAGKTDSRQKIYDMAESLRQKHGLDVQCILTKKQGHATELAKSSARRARRCGFTPAAATGLSTRWPTVSSAMTTPP